MVDLLNARDGVSAQLIKYRNDRQSQKSDSKPGMNTISFNLLHILLRIGGVYRFSGRFSTSAKKIGPMAMSNFLIKWDLKLRKATLNTPETIFVVVVSPFTNYLLVPWLKKEFNKARIVLDIGDPLYLNSARDNSDDYSKGVEKKAVTVADAILVTNHPTKQFFTDMYNVPANIISVVPQGVDVELIAAAKPADRKPTPHTLAYAGRFYKGLRWPAALFEALSGQSTYTLHLYGNGWGKPETNVVEHPKMPQDELFKQLHSHELLVFIDNDKGIQTSGKIYELLAFGKPLLFIKGSERSEAEDLAAQHKHVIFTENEPDAIRKALKEYEQRGVAENTEPLMEYSWKARAELYKKALAL